MLWNGRPIVAATVLMILLLVARLGYQLEHLHLPPSLTRKLAPKFIGPFFVLAIVTPASFHLSLPVGWKIHDVFHVS